MLDISLNVVEKEPFSFHHILDKIHERRLTKDTYNEESLKEISKRYLKEHKAKRKSPALMRAFY